MYFLLCVGIQEHSEIKQSVSKLTEEVSDDFMFPHYYLCKGALELIFFSEDMLS